ncbi:hypothetical protein G6N05_06455 [Flavobacterium sp. F372]|uniref:Outer membrane protein beta-barrel domain-containing protein n=1 Tax=Flavobacterium bernardetii TaxID=2813823 RepID=A0ABR7J0C0_9FLAO|nr:hypothetical protein [Flavobacterium bernardetii]MBC5835403.1 hypothetical protein [Flavobacterium bernardetii]NHF69746.1 hypothetical protein [Flavobacterium bernardetii]
MENKKDIGKLFKDNLSQLDYSPSEMVWDKIETDLKKDKRKRRFFFWIFFSSLIIIGITSYSYYHFNSVNEETNNGTNSTALNSNTNQNNNTISNNSEENTNSNTKQNNNTVLNNSKENVISNNSRNNNTKNHNNSYNFNTTKKSDLKYNSKNNSNKTNATKKSLVSNSRTKSGKKSSYETNVAMKKSLVSNTNRTKETSGYKNSRNTKSNKANLFKLTDYNLYSNTNKAIKNTITKKKIRSNNLNNNKTESINFSKNSSSTYNSTTSLNENNISNSQVISFSKIDSCCSDENCIVTIEQIQEKIKKKKLPETKEDTVVKPKSKILIVSPFAGFNTNYKIGTENKFGNSEVIDGSRKYGNLFGLKLKWMFSEKTGIQSGVSINTFYYNTTVKNLNGNLQTESIELNQDSSTINAVFSNSEKITFQQHLRYIEIPIEAYHYFNTSKLNHAASFGLSFYLPIKNEVNAYSENVSKMNIGKSLAYLKQGYGLNLNYYLNYNLSDKIQIFVSPAAQFQFLGNFDYAQPTSYSFSISSGINYKF